MGRTKAVLYLDPLRRDEQLAFVRERVDPVWEFGDQLWGAVTEEQVPRFNDQGITVQLHDEADLVVLPSVVFRPPAEEPDPPTDLAATAPAGDATAYYVVQFVAPPASQWLATAAERGAEFVDGLPPGAAAFRMTSGQADAARGLPFVAWVGLYHPAFALDPALAGRDRPFTAADLRTLRVDPARVVATGTGTLALYFFSDVATADAVSLVTAAGARNVLDTGYSLIVDAEAGDLVALLRVPGVRAIEPYHPDVLQNERAGFIIGARQVQSFRHVDYLVNLDGAGEIVGVIDTGLDRGVTAPVHPDFAGRVVAVLNINDPAAGPPVDRTDYDGHGTHVSGSIVGDGTMASSVTAPLPNHSVPRGMAPAASLIMHSANPPGTLPPPPGQRPMRSAFANFFRGIQAAHAAGARVHSHSFAPQKIHTGNAYTNRSAAIDREAFLHPESLLVFASGNDEEDANKDGMLDMDSLGDHAVAKNILCVGACENDTNKDGDEVSYRERQPSLVTPKDYTHSRFDPVAGPAPISGKYPQSDSANDLALFSNRGRVTNPTPPLTGRIRPDLVAPGTNVMSCRSSAMSDPPDFEAATTAPPNGYYVDSGTSMATPIVAGAAALVRQFYRARFGQLRRPVLLQRLTRFEDRPAIAPHVDGVVVAWPWHAPDGTALLAVARFTRDFELIDLPVVVNVDVGAHPSVALDRLGDNTAILVRSDDGTLTLGLLDRSLTPVITFGTAGDVTLPAASRTEDDRRPGLSALGEVIAVVWTKAGSDDLVFQRFSAKKGTAVDASPVTLGTATFASSHPYVTHDTTRFVVIWGRLNGANHEVLLRVVGDAGPVGNGPSVLASQVAPIADPHVTWDYRLGRFTACWVDGSTHPGGAVAVLGVNLDGTPGGVGPTAAITLLAPNALRQPFLAMHPAAGYVLAWEDDTQERHRDVYLAFLDDTGALDTRRVTELGNRLRISDTPQDTQGFAALADGAGVVPVWMSNDEINSDLLGLFALRVTAQGTFRAQSDPNTPLLDSGRYIPHRLIQHPGPTHTAVALAWNGGNTFLLRPEPAAAGADLFLVRTNSDGKPDESFGPDGGRRLFTAPRFDRLSLLWAETRLMGLSLRGTRASLHLFDTDGNPIAAFGAGGIREFVGDTSPLVAPQAGFQLVAGALRSIVAYGVRSGAGAALRYAVFDPGGVAVGAVQPMDPNPVDGTAAQGWFHFVPGETKSVAVWHATVAGSSVLRLNTFDPAGALQNAAALSPTTLAGDSRSAVLAPRPAIFPLSSLLPASLSQQNLRREYGLAWQYRPTPASRWEIRFTWLDRNGRPKPAPAIPNQLVASSPTDHLTDPQLVWHLDGYGLAWLQQPAAGGDHALFFTTLDPTGANVTAPPFRVSRVGADVQDFHLVWNGRSFRVTWSETEGGNLRHMQSGLALVRPGEAGGFDNPYQHPSSALVRATLINGATNIRGTALPNIPGTTLATHDFNDGYGWGRVNLRQSLAPAVPVTFHVRDDNSVARNTTGKVRYLFTLPAGTRLLRATLAWTDPPGVDLVNPLSLTVVTPPYPGARPRTFVSNRWQASPSARHSAPVAAVPPPGGFENVHNVQQIVIPDPPPGTYTVEVIGGAFRNNGYQTFPGQPFALVFVGSGDEWPLVLPPTGPLPFY